MEMLISARETARRLGVSRGLIYSWHYARKPPYSRIFVKVSRRLMIDCQRLEELVNLLREESTEPKDGKVIFLDGNLKEDAPQ